MEIKFERFDDGRWFVVFPEYEGPQEDLEMVEGADKFLDMVTEDNLEVNLYVSTEELVFGITFELISHDDFGAYYNVLGFPEYEGTIWLCNVAHEFFGEHPEKIYCSIID